jgi:hypothetical protein
MQTLFGAGCLGLRSLATGIPVSILANPRRALAEPLGEARSALDAAGQFLILSTSADGDPLGCNAPGMYLDPGIAHPVSPTMAPAQLTLGGSTFTAATPWSQLPQALLDRSCFFHHGTYTVVHPDEPKVLALGGYTSNNEMLISLLAAKLAPTLGTIQAEPIVLGPRNPSEGVVFEGRPQPIVSPSALALLLGPPTGPLGKLAKLRDRDLGRMNGWLKREGTPAQAAFVDRYVQSQSQLRAVSQSLLSVLQGIHDDSVASQLVAAVTLIRMNVAPVISLHIPFGGDNHSDGGLMTEAAQTVSGVASLKDLWSLLLAQGLQDRVSFLSLNVFGRTLGVQKSSNGRAHNGDHHVALMFGAGFRGSVIGGVEPMGDDFGAMSIDSATGQGVAGGGGDIPFESTLQAMATTFGAGVGLDPAFLAETVSGGTAVAAALAPA